MSPTPGAPTLAAPAQRATAAARPMYRPLDWVLIRAPLLPVDAYLALGAADGQAGSWVLRPGSLVPLDPRIRRALVVGSPELLAALERAAPDARGAEELRGKLLRYVIRMSTRPTPYGLFAGVALAGWGPATDLAIGHARPRTRPDMEWLLGLVLRLEAQPDVRRALRFTANPCAVIRGGRVVLAESAPGESAAAGAPMSLRATGIVRRVLAAARRPTPYAELAAGLCASTPAATAEQVEQVLRTLCERTVLVSDLRPPLTATSPARYVADRLATIPAAGSARDDLESLLASLGAWDALPPEDGAAEYRQLTVRADAVSHTTSCRTHLQTDTILALDGRHIARVVGDEVARAAELLLRLTPLPHGLPYLHGYQQAFASRYGVEREVPLLELLDPDVGLGPPAGHHHGSPEPDAARSAARQRTLQALAITAIRERRLVAELDGPTLARLETYTPSAATAPISLEVAVFVAAASAAALDAGEFQLVVGPNLGASAAGRHLGRFADLLAPESHAALGEVVRAEAEQLPNRLRAELVYLPQHLRSANVAVRPAVRDYEIVVGTSAGVPSTRAIRLDELVLGVRDERFYVRWPAENAEVVACAGHMLNGAQAPAAFRFLEDVAHGYGAQFMAFDWGRCAGLPFLPRVQVGRVVLSPAEWRIDPAAEAGEVGGASPATFREWLADWRLRWDVPRWVYLSTGDNRLLLDLESAEQAGELRTELLRAKDGRSVVLQEALPATDQAWVPGPGGHFVTEFVVPLTLGAPAAREAITPGARVAAGGGVGLAARVRPPGSDWLFVKLYCVPVVEDELIAGSVRQFGEFARSAGLAHEWFFIRYADPDNHLRLRFRGDPRRLVSEFLPLVCSWAAELVEDGRCLRFVIDTYDREVERYGGEAGTAAAETLFAADSRAVAELLHVSQQQPAGCVDRTTLGVVGVDDLLAGLGLAVPDRLRWYTEYAFSRHDTGPEYRRRKATLRALLGDPGALLAQPGGPAVAQVLATRRQALAGVARRLRAASERGLLGQPLDRLYQSFVHLHCNRLLGRGGTSERDLLGLLLRARESLRG